MARPTPCASDARNCAVSPQSASIGRTSSRVSGERSQTSSSSYALVEEHCVAQRITNLFFQVFPVRCGLARAEGVSQ